MDPVTALIFILVFCAIVWGGFWICTAAGFPLPVRWLWGGLCLIVMIGFLMQKFGLYNFQR